MFHIKIWSAEQVSLCRDRDAMAQARWLAKKSFVKGPRELTGVHWRHQPFCCWALRRKNHHVSGRQLDSQRNSVLRNSSRIIFVCIFFCVSGMNLDNFQNSIEPLQLTDFWRGTEVVMTKVDFFPTECYGVSCNVRLWGWLWFDFWAEIWTRFWDGSEAGLWHGSAAGSGEALGSGSGKIPTKVTGRRLGKVPGNRSFE